MELNLKNVQSQPYFEIIRKLARREKLKVYLVGGFLRDLALKRSKEKTLDFDFAVNKNSRKLARILAREIKGAFVLLDAERGLARVVKNLEDKALTFDFADFRGKNIKADLAQRDFTINTLALNLDEKGKTPDLSKALLDYFHAIDDLKARTIRMVSPEAFLEDPLRLLRAFSLSAQLDFKIEADTLKKVRRLAKKINEVAYERIRDELFKILETNHAAIFVRQMDRVKILDKIIPQIRAMYGVKQGPYHHLDVFKHSLETLLQVEKLILELSSHQKIQRFLKEEIASNRSRSALIKLGALLHDIGKPLAKRKKAGKTVFYGHERMGREITKGISDMLKLSTREKFALEKLIFWHLRPGYLAEGKKPTPRAIFRFFRDAEEEGVAILLLGIADQRSTRGPLTKGANRKHHEKVVMDLIEHYFKKQEEKPLVRLIDGNDLIKKLKLTPGPVFAKILREVEEAQAEGSIKTREEALRLARRIAKKA